MSIDKQLDALINAVKDQEKPITKEEMKEVLASMQEDQEQSTYRTVSEKPVIVDVMNMSDAAAKKLGSMLSDDEDDPQTIEVEQTEQAAPMGIIGKILKFAKDMFINVLKLVGKAVGWVISTLTDILGKLTDWVLQKIKLGAMIAIGKSATQMGGGFRKLRLVSTGFKLAGAVGAGLTLANILKGGEEFKQSMGNLNKTADGIFGSPESIITSGTASMPSFSSLGGSPETNTGDDSSGGDTSLTMPADDVPSDMSDSTSSDYGLANIDAENQELEAGLIKQIQEQPMQLDPTMSEEDKAYNRITTDQEETALQNISPTAGVKQLDKMVSMNPSETKQAILKIELPKTDTPSAPKPTTTSSQPSGKDLNVNISKPQDSSASSSPMMTKSTPVRAASPSTPSISSSPPPSSGMVSKPKVEEPWPGFYEENAESDRQMDESGLFKETTSVLDSLNKNIKPAPASKVPVSSTSASSPSPVSINMSPRIDGVKPKGTSGLSPGAPSAVPAVTVSSSTPPAAIKPPSQSSSTTNLTTILNQTKETLSAATNAQNNLKQSIENKGAPSVKTITTVEDRSRTPDINSTHRFRESVHNGI